MAVTHSLSATTPDDPSFEIRPSHWNQAHFQLLTISGDTAGVSTHSGTNLVFSGTNVTLSVTGNTLAFSAPAASQLAVAGGLTLSTNGNTITVSAQHIGLNTALTAGPLAWTVNSSGLSLNAGSAAGNGFTSTTTAGTEVEATLSTNGLSMAVPAFLTTAALSNHSHGNPTLNLTNLSGTTASNSAGFTLSLSAGGAGGGATISQWPMGFPSPGQRNRNTATSGNTGASTQLTVSLTAHPMVLPHALTYDAANLFASCGTVAGTASATVGFWYGIYTLNGGTALSLITNATGQFNQVLTQNSVTARTASWWYGTDSAANSSSLSGNVSASFVGQHLIPLTSGAQSLAAGQYWVMAGHSARTSGSNIHSSDSLLGHGEYPTPGGFPNWGSNNTLQQSHLAGIFSTTTNTNSTGFGVWPASVNTSALTTFPSSGQAVALVLRSNQ